MKRIFSLTLAMITGLCLSLHAELVWKSGYILLMSGDSVKGDIRVNTKKELPLFEKVAIKIGEATKTYKPEQVKEYAFENTKFLARKVDGEVIFLKVLSEGQVNLYELQFEVQRGNELVIDKEYYIERNDRNGGPEKAKPSKFKKTVEELMSDNTNLVTRVQSADKKYEIADMTSIVDEYNTWYQQNNGTFTGSR